MEPKREVEILENALKLCLRVQIQGFEAQPAGEAIDFLKKIIDERKAALPPEPKEVQDESPSKDVTPAA